MKKAGLWMGMGMILFSLFLPGRTAGQDKPAASPSQRMDQLFDFWNRQDQPGFAVVVVQDGRVAYQKTFGLACQEHGAAITPNSVFNTAALAQIFVGQAVAILESQGRLSLDDDIRKHLPELPDWAAPIKVRHLLYHASGIRDWLAVLQLAGREAEEVTLPTVLKIVQAQKMGLFPPGDQALFSNTDYDLLAEMIRRLTGRPFPEWAWENIFKPAKMTRTQYRDSYRAVLDDQAFSYNFTRQEYLKGIDTLSLAGSHSLFASIADLGKWLLALQTAPAESQAIFAKMFAPGGLNDGRGSGFGDGLNIETSAGRRQISQMGTWAGSGAHLVYLPDQRLGFVVLANWDYTPVSGFAGSILEIYLPAAAPAPAAPKAPAGPAAKAVQVRPEILDRYAGHYRLGSGLTLAIGREGDRLRLSVSGRNFLLTARAENEFILDGADLCFVFQKSPDGKSFSLVWRQGGEEEIARRVVLVKPTPEELKAYAGSFADDETGLRLSIELRGASLILLRPGQADVPLAPDEKDRFTSRWPSAPAIAFQRDGQGRVTGFQIDSAPLRGLDFKRDGANRP